MLLPRPVLGIAIIGIIAGSIWATVPEAWTAAKETTTTEWQLLGTGNLEAIQVGDKWLLHSVPTTYIQDTQGKKFDLRSPTVYAPKPDLPVASAPLSVPAKSTLLNTPNGHSLRVLKTDEQVFDATNAHSQPLADGRLVFADSKQENIWLVDQQGTVSPLLDSTGLAEAQKLTDEYWKQDDAYGSVVWAAHPLVSEDGNTVLFYSNRDNIRNKFFADNIYAVDVTEKDKRPRLVFDSKPYKMGVQLINMVDDTVVGYIGPTNTLLLHDLKKAKTTEMLLGGYPTSLSPDGRTLLYRKVEKNVVGLDFYLRDINTGKDTKAAMPQGYFFNQIGAWSPNGGKFAFYLNGFQDNNPSKRYRTHVKIGVLDVESATISVYNPPPKAGGTLYPLGSISWLDNQQVVAYTTDDTSWALTID